jgi:tetratricopeptide (TPR) repeat protein
MRTIKPMKLIALALVVGLAACGGANKGGGTTAGGGGGTDGPAPPPVPPPGKGGEEAPKVVVSADARSDFEKAGAFFAQTEKANGWNESTCGQSAEAFAAVAKEHRELADAQYMVGLSWHRCNNLKKAEEAYQKTLQMNSNHAQSMSNLGEIYYRQGKNTAKQWWQRAVQAYQKLVAARNNLASMILEEMRTTSDAKAFAQLDKEAQNHLSSVLAVDNDNIKAYTLYAMVFMEGRKRNKNRLDLAKLLMDEADKRNPNYAPLRNARGLLFLYRNNLGAALKQFQAAVQLDPNFVEARMNVGLTTLGFRSYDQAKEQFDAVLAINPKNYDAKIGVGIALRGKGDLAGAEKAYNEAKGLDGARGEAYYNLGVLEKDFKATAVNDLKDSKVHYKKAQDYFEAFLQKSGTTPDDKAEAKNNVEDCVKLQKQVDDFLKMQAQQDKMRQEFEKSNPPTPETTPAPAPAPAPTPKK